MSLHEFIPIVQIIIGFNSAFLISNHFLNHINHTISGAKDGLIRDVESLLVSCENLTKKVINSSLGVHVDPSINTQKLLANDILDTQKTINEFKERIPSSFENISLGDQFNKLCAFGLIYSIVLLFYACPKIFSCDLNLCIWTLFSIITIVWVFLAIKRKSDIAYLNIMKRAVLIIGIVTIFMVGSHWGCEKIFGDFKPDFLATYVQLIFILLVLLAPCFHFFDYFIITVNRSNLTAKYLRESEYNSLYNKIAELTNSVEDFVTVYTETGSLSKYENAKLDGMINEEVKIDAPDSRQN